MEILNFQNLDIISTSNWGKVYRAYDPLLERTVALKVICPGSATGDLCILLAEARAAAALDHPNICPIHQVHQLDDGSFVMVLNWCSGGSLSDILEGGPLAGESALDMARSIVNGLSAIHQAGLLHRDIKPGNVLIDSRRQPRWSDFGLSALEPNTIDSQPLMVGTMPYMAPELFKGSQPSVAADVWALGALLFQIVHGQPPFTDAYQAALRYSIEFEELPEVHLQDALAQQVLTAARACLAKDPNRRPESAEAVLELLTEPETEPEAKNDSKSSQKWIVLAGGGALLLVLVLFMTGMIPGLWEKSKIETREIWGVTVLPFTSVGGDETDAALARGLSQNTAHALLQLEPDLPRWWFVPPRRIHLRKINNLTRSRGLTGATYAITGRLEKLSDDLYQLNLRKEQVGAGIQDSGQELVVELTASRNDLTAWQIEIPRRIVQLLGAPWPQNAETRLRVGGTSVPKAFSFFLQGRGLLAPKNDEPDTTAIRQAFENAVRADQNYAQAWWGLGLSDEKSGGPGSRDQARRKWSRSLSLAPDLELSLAALASSFHATEEDSTALKYLTLLGNGHPGDFRAQLALGEVYAALGDSSAAHMAFNQAIALHPGDAVGPNSLGAFFFNYTANTQAAIEAFNQATKEASDDPETLLFLGACHFANDHLSKSLGAFERSLSLEPNALALEYLAIIHFYQGSFARAGALANELLQHDDSRYEVWSLLGVCQEQIPGQHLQAGASFEKAAALCRAAIHHTDDRPSLWAMMGLLEAKLGNFSIARQWLERTAARDQLSGDTMLNIADGFEILGDRDSAFLWLKKLFDTGYSSVAVDRHPGFADLRSDSRYRELQ